MVITTKIKIDLASRTAASERVEAVQDDKYSRNVEISLYAGGVALKPPAGTAAIVHYQKSDNTGGHYDTLPDGSSACSITGNTVMIRLAPQVCTAAGTVKVSVGLIHGTEELYTFPFIINVQPRPGIGFVSEDYNNVNGYVSSSGWEPNSILTTDANGNVQTAKPSDIAVPGGTGMTPEQAAQLEQNTTDIADLKDSVQQNREDIDALPVTVTEDGYTDIAGQRQPTDIVFTRTEQNIAIDITMQGAVAYNGVLELDENGFPAKYTENGLEVSMGFVGFDDLVTTVWEGGSY